VSGITIHIPWILLIPIVMLALYGLIEFTRRCWQVYCLYQHLKTADKKYNQDLHFLTDADQKAKEIIDAKINEIWRSFKLSNWFDIPQVGNECYDHVSKIAAVYHPNAKQPEFEITVIELLRLNERINHRIITVLQPLESLQKISVNSLIDAHTILEQTRDTINQKGLRTGAGVASRIWQAINVINPQYWINYVVLHGVSELVYRKAIASVYQIVGNEAVKIYRSSSAENIDIMKAAQEAAQQQSEIDSKQKTESNEQTIEPEIMEEDPSKFHEEHGKINTDEDIKEKSFQEKLYHKIGDTFTSFLEGGLHFWEKLAKPDSIFKHYQKQGINIQQLNDIHTLPLQTAQQVSLHYRKKGEWLSAAEGAATGVGGFMLIAVDAVSLIALQLRTIQQVGYCYGFNMSSPEEKLFAAKLLIEAYQHPSSKDRKAVLMQMKWAAQLLKGTSPIKFLYKRLFENGIQKAVQIIGIKLGSRKAAQLVPFLGAAVGGYLNKRVMKDIAEIADEVYQERFLSRQQMIGYENVLFTEVQKIGHKDEVK
jgi:hypothetical protein